MADSKSTAVTSAVGEQSRKKVQESLKRERKLCAGLVKTLVADVLGHRVLHPLRVGMQLKLYLNVQRGMKQVIL